MCGNADHLQYRAPDSKKVIKSYPVLYEYADRIHEKYFPDYEKWSV